MTDPKADSLAQNLDPIRAVPGMSKTLAVTVSLLAESTWQVCLRVGSCLMSYRVCLRLHPMCHDPLWGISCLGSCMRSSSSAQHMTLSTACHNTLTYML